MTEIIELHPNPALMDRSFEKYQFVIDAIPVISEITLKKHVYRLEPNSNQESWLEARLFAFHNHLFKNAYDTSCWFVDEDWNVWRLDENGSLDHIHTLHTADADLSKIIYNPSIGFATNKIVVICDGGEKLEILIRDTGQNIKVLVLDPVQSGVIMNVQYIQASSKIIVTICAIVDNGEKKYTQLTLLSYSLEYLDNEISNILYIDKQILKVQGTVDYVYLEKSGNYLHSICQDSIGFEKENIQESENKSTNDDSQIRVPKYYWSQDEDSLTVWIKIPKQHCNKQPKIDIKALELSVIIDNDVLIQGKCQHRLDEDMATWKQQEDTLQIELSKHENGLMWNELIQGDTGGECLPNTALAAEIHTRLAHLCTDQPNNSVEEGQPCIGFNSEQLEECDLEGRENFLQRVNLHTQATTHLARLGSNNHVLFTYELKGGQVICFRHDHDACIWLIDDLANKQWNLKHVYSFPGFGYVEASKTNKKFCVSPIDASYIAIVEHTRHVFLYEKPKNGLKIAKQKIVNLDDMSPIMGVIATNKNLIILLKNKLYRLQICI